MIWKVIKNYPNYSVSNTGLVKNNKSNRVLKPWISQGGYYILRLGNSTNKAIHRLVAETFIINFKNKKDVNHKNGIKLDNNVKNLEWTTRSENCQHSYDNGLSTYRPFGHKNSTGSKNCMAKLSESDIITIRRLRNSKNMTYSEIAKIYGVNQATIGYIVTNKTWKHV